MADEILALKGHGNVDVQIGGPGNSWAYLSACAALSGPTVPRGGTEVRWCQDPQRSGGFRISSKIRTAPDQVTGDLMTKLGKIDYLDGMECPFGLRARFSKCAEREDPSNYDPLMLSYCDVDLQEHSYDDLAITDPGNEDEILITAPWAAAHEYRIKKLNGSRIGASTTNLGDQPINDIEYCDSFDCGGDCGSRSTPCRTFWGVTDVDVTPYASPNLIKGVLNLTTLAITYTLTPVLGFNNNLEGVECAGSRLVVSSNGDSAIGYNDNDGDQDEWNVVVLTYAPAANPNALFARTARELWVAAATGRVYKSSDGGSTYTAVHDGDLTTENLVAVWAYDSELVYAVGEDGTILRSQDGGETWTDLTETSTTGANLLVVVVPPGRPKEVFIGTNAGQIFKSTDEGDNWSSYSFTGDGVGSVDDIAFCGPCAGETMFILHNDAGPRGRVLRDLSGGAGGADVEIVFGYTDIVKAGVQLNALACCDPNEVLAAGELSGAYPILIKAH